MKKYCEEKPSSRARAHFIMMQGAYLSESGDWKDSIANVKFDLDKLNLNIKGVQEFTQGMLAYAQEDKESLSKSIKKINTLRVEGEKSMVMGAPKMCSGVSSYLQPPSTNEVNSTKVLEMELKALLAVLNKDAKSAEKWFKEAVDIEENTTYTYGPPNIVKPSFELYGEWLVKEGRKDEATKQFKKVLTRAPKRMLAMKGIEASS